MDGPRSHNVLVIDDQPDIGQLVSILLARRGHETTVVTTPHDALTLDPDSHAVSLILVDLGVTRGEEALTFDALGATFPNRPIVIMSGHSETAAHDELQRPDVVGFIRKPFRPDDILKFLEPTGAA